MLVLLKNQIKTSITRNTTVYLRYCAEHLDNIPEDFSQNVDDIKNYKVMSRADLIRHVKNHGISCTDIFREKCHMISIESHETSKKLFLYSSLTECESIKKVDQGYVLTCGGYTKIVSAQKGLWTHIDYNLLKKKTTNFDDQVTKATMSQELEELKKFEKAICCLELRELYVKLHLLGDHFGVMCDVRTYCIQLCCFLFNIKCVII